MVCFNANSPFQECVDWGLEDDCREYLVRTPADGLAVITAVTHEMKAEDYTPTDVLEVRLALEEALINAIKHGHQGDPRKRVRVNYCVTPEGVLAEVEDEGPGFDPGDVPDPTDPDNLERPSGRGLFLIRAYMSWVRFNQRGNKLSFCKFRSAG